jgi:hypothetical protein
MEKRNLTKKGKGVFYSEIFDSVAKDFLLGSDYVVFAQKISERFRLTPNQWGEVLTCWEEKEITLS